MKAKLIGLILFVTTSFGAFSQSVSADTSGKRKMFPRDPNDTLQWTRVAVHKTSDTVYANTSKAPEIKRPSIRTDKRWFLSPFLKWQTQDFGMLEKQRKGYLSDAETLSFTGRTNRSAAFSAYKNFSEHFSASIDLGAGKGHITSKDSLVSTTKSRTYGLGAANIYFNLLGNQFKLQPFLAAGINAMFSKGTFLSAPVGMGAKYSGKKIMITGEAAYGYSVSANIANTLMYSVGIYIPFRTKKQKQADAEDARKRDTGLITITNVTNNYYFYNQDSAKRAQDSLLAEITKKRLQDEDDDDPDDPMKLPNATKHTVYFYYDQYALTTSAFGVIDVIVQKMKDNPKLSVHLKGHTDMIGSEQYNAPLSKRRAQMVFDYMNSRGIAAERMILSGYGKRKPAVRKQDPNNAWLNRRCEMVLFEKKN